MTTTTGTVTAATIAPLLSRVRDAADASGSFGGLVIRDGMLVCRAKAAAAPASYRLLADRGRVYVALVMADRWLSESIEADLMHTGDKLESLIDEELIEHGLPSDPRPVEHFRSDDLLFTFRTALPLVASDVDSDRGGRVAGAWLMAYEAAFRVLGDMSGGEA
ncbi:MAG: hypothetical protein IT437_12535 [Phycisphaerales bacterium]|nr:hypothetical protein [Phycisphaerales bacterium]